MRSIALSLFTSICLVGLGLITVIGITNPTHAATEEAKTFTKRQVASASGLPLPRFVTLGTKRARMRRGPGVKYPVDWIFQRKGLPLEVVQEFELWRKVRDVDGAEGWMHKSLLSGRRMGRITGEKRPVREAPIPNSPITFYAEGAVLVRLEQCSEQFCRVNVENLEGWILKDHLWGVYKAEIID